MLYLLEERERDLNIVVCIGQFLVKQNSVLMEENSKLEVLLGLVKEEILYFRYQVNLWDDFFQFYLDFDEEEEEEVEEDQQCVYFCDVFKLILQEVLLYQYYCLQLEVLQEKLRFWEEKNYQLREEVF